MTWPRGSEKQPQQQASSSGLSSAALEDARGTQRQQQHRRHSSTSCAAQTAKQQHFRNAAAMLSSQGGQQQQQQRGERERHLTHESVTLFNNIGLDGLSSSRKGLAHKHDPADLEKRFWREGSELRRPGFSCSSSTGGVGLWSQQAQHAVVLALPPGSCDSDFSQLPFDVLRRISGGFSWPNLWATSLVCKSWYQAVAPLREAVLFVKWGKRFKHGRGGVAQNTEKALDSFLKGAVRGCAAAMIDAGLLLWEQGKREEGIRWYKQAAELGDAAGQCNLGLALLQDPGDTAEAVAWFQRAANAGHVRAQYSLALCLQQGRGVECNPSKAAKWYLRAAEGGSTRAMYNTALCYLSGEGFARNYHEARHWMRCAALAGHRKAQFEHGLTLFAEGDGGLALAFLELATRAGETAAIHIRDALLQQLPAQERANALACADNWKKQMSR